MTQKEWLILAGIVAFLWWRHHSQTLAVTAAAAGNSAGGSAGVQLGVAPVGPGNMGAPSGLLLPIITYPLSLSAA